MNALALVHVQILIVEEFQLLLAGSSECIDEASVDLAATRLERDFT
jgi:hypothetical protein